MKNPGFFEYFQFFLKGFGLQGGKFDRKMPTLCLILKNRNIIRKNFVHDWIVCKCSHKMAYFVSFCKFNYGNFSDPKIWGFCHFDDAKSKKFSAEPNQRQLGCRNAIQPLSHGRRYFHRIKSGDVFEQIFSIVASHIFLGFH